MENFDLIIIGAGILGLSTAYEFLNRAPGAKVCILEKEKKAAAHQTGHNSGVIHSGIYYKPGSLKAKNCRTGYELLINFCQNNDVDFEICGKLVIAADEKEIPAMNELYKRGIENGLENLEVIDSRHIRDFEPYAAGVKALHVPQTGIVDYISVCKKISSIISGKNCRINFNEEVKSINCTGQEVTVSTSSGKYMSGCLVSCAGLYSDRIASLSGMKTGFRIIPFRGEYFSIKEERKNLVRNLIYPVPDPEFPFLGVHFTRRKDGITEAGPNAVLAFGKESYAKSDFNFKETFDTFTYSGFRKIASKYWKTGFYEMYRSFSKKEFVRSLQRLVPEITGNDLLPGGSGIRAQACSEDGKLIDDFLFAENENIINICNAPSPAATSAFSIAGTITDKIFNKLN
ncbi:MAG: L-2-hydroxyglutarate oxidase [Bacteroidetes bacterium]|nr:L-2-hydroxyglutarate oxidase [Bacteroidota bacterium]